MPWVSGRHLSKDLERCEDNILESVQKDRDLFMLVLRLHVKSPELSDGVYRHIWLHNPSIYGSLSFAVHFLQGYHVVVTPSFMTDNWEWSRVQ